MTTGIEWSDETWNPLVGCEWASPGCDGCYAARDAAGRLKNTPTYQGLAVRMADGSERFTGELRLLPDRLDQPLRWQRPRRIFVNSMSDLFHPDVPSAYIAEVFAVMALARRHTFQVLTKRPARMAKLLVAPEFQNDLAAAIVRRWPSKGRGGATMLSDRYPLPLPNVWLGTSVESQEYAWRVEHVRKTPAAVRWVSVEPLVGPITDASAIVRGMDWIVAGGESGPKARPMHPDWLRLLRDACLDAREPCEVPGTPRPHSVYVPGGGRTCAWYPQPIAFLVKQWGEWAPGSSHGGRTTPLGSTPQGGAQLTIVDRDGAHRSTNDVSGFHLPAGWERMQRIGKRAAGRELDGVVWDQYPVART